mgnify:CR=1 FL=1
MGSSNANRLPFPSSLSRVSLVPWACTIWSATGRPRPVPIGLEVAKGSKGSMSSGIPSPVSWTSMRSRSSVSRMTRRSVPPSGIAAPAETETGYLFAADLNTPRRLETLAGATARAQDERRRQVVRALRVAWIEAAWHAEAARLVAAEGADLLTERPTGGLLPSPFRFRPCGDSGVPVSELLPQLSQHIDDICVIRSMVTEQINHDPAHTFMNTGTAISGR